MHVGSVVSNGEYAGIVLAIDEETGATTVGYFASIETHEAPAAGESSELSDGAPVPVEKKKR